MAAGQQLTRGDLDTEIGRSLKDVNVALTRAEAIRDFLVTRTDQELVDLGYTQGEVDQIRSAFGDMDLLWKIYRGAQPLAVAQDFRQFAKRLWGLGVE